jgi:hypothetical protein
VVLAAPDRALHPNAIYSHHSHLYRSGRLGNFAVAYDEEAHDPELVVLLDDIRGLKGGTQLTPVHEDYEPYDVLSEQQESKLFDTVKKLLESPNFSFAKLALLCQDIEADNLNLALFAAALNDFRLPSHMASAICVRPLNVYYYSGGIDVAPAGSATVRYPLTGADMFSFISPVSDHRTLTNITTMMPSLPMMGFRNIRIDHHVVGHDLA